MMQNDFWDISFRSLKSVKLTGPVNLVLIIIRIFDIFRVLFSFFSIDRELQRVDP